MEYRRLLRELCPGRVGRLPVLLPVGLEPALAPASGVEQEQLVTKDLPVRAVGADETLFERESVGAGDGFGGRGDTGGETREQRECDARLQLVAVSLRERFAEGWRMRRLRRPAVH